MSIDIVEMLKEPKMITVCAPMVRYSKLQFRSLVRQYNCDICFTPMILADSFVQSEKARDNEFSTNNEDKPVIVQFAAKNVYDFLNATEMVAPYCNGVDLNCGCPQRWALKEGYGADLLRKPDLVKDLVYQVKNRIPNPFTVSVKIRLLKDIRKTIELCQVLEKAGASFLTVHARTQTAEKLYMESNCEAVMAARGILTNPALFSGHSVTPLDCIQDWLDITSVIPTQFLCFHHHLVFMLEKLLPKKSRIFFNNLQNKTAVLEFLENTYGIKPNNNSKLFEPIKCNFKVPNMKCNKFIAKDEDDFNVNFLGNIFVEP